jgi:hypothetical protein
MKGGRKRRRGGGEGGEVCERCGDVMSRGL